MEIEAEISEIHTTRKIIILKDKLGNVATGQTYNEALSYLMLRKKKKLVREKSK